MHRWTTGGRRGAGVSCQHCLGRKSAARALCVQHDDDGVQSSTGGDGHEALLRALVNDRFVGSSVARLLELAIS